MEVSNGVKFNKLTLKDKKLFTEFLELKAHYLSSYAFVNIYIWKGLFEIYWMRVKDSLCVFFKDRLGCFLYLPPLSKGPRSEIIKEVFIIMDIFNKNKDISRIENVEDKELSFYKKLGYEYKEKPGDYLCQRMDLVHLKGNKFKSKRSCFNYFTKHYEFEYLPFSLEYKQECLKLYDRWMTKRKLANKDNVYQGMLEDSRNCLKILMDDYQYLDVIGRVLKIKNETEAFTPLEKSNKSNKNSLTGFTFGFKLNKDTFCILYEITDLSIKGLAQFIFKEFCRELSSYKYINIMDDSGLANLKKTKLSYHPQRLIPNYIVTRKDAENR